MLSTLIYTKGDSSVWSLSLMATFFEGGVGVYVKTVWQRNFKWGSSILCMSSHCKIKTICQKCPKQMLQLNFVFYVFFSIISGKWSQKSAWQIHVLVSYFISCIMDIAPVEILCTLKNVIFDKVTVMKFITMNNELDRANAIILLLKSGHLNPKI